MHSYSFGKILKMLREEKEVSQVKLAESLGVSKSQISFWENDKGEPTLTNIKKIAVYFNVTADYLLGLTED